MKIKKAIVTPKDRPGLDMTPKYITIHETGNTAEGANAASHARWLPTVAPNPSYHFTVDDKEVYQHLPLDENGWHASDGNRGPGNRQSIGIEICVNSDGDFQKAKQKAAELCEYLLDSISTLKAFPEAIKQHHDWDNTRNCPRNIRNNNQWTAFLEMIEGESSSASSKLPDAVYRLKPTYIKGTGVRAVQEALDSLGYESGSNGQYGPKTQKSVEKFQEDAGITVDGIYGPETKGALLKALDENPAKNFDLPDGIIQLKEPYENGNHVKQIQEALDSLGYSGGTNGYYGPRTEQSVRNFQQDAGIGVDGIYGPETKGALEDRL